MVQMNFYRAIEVVIAIKELRYAIGTFVEGVVWNVNSLQL